MAHLALVSVFCPDRTGLVAAVTGRLFDLGVNLGDTSFSILGSGAELTAVCECPDSLSLDELEDELKDIADLGPAEIKVLPFTLDPRHGPNGEITHNITVRGGDQPGLIARICEVFIEFRANIVRLDAGASPDSGGEYIIRLAVFIPEASAVSCLATLQNTTEGLHLSFEAEKL
jgi:glycine cleavage system transcriptional repressor